MIKGGLCSGVGLPENSAPPVQDGPFGILMVAAFRLAMGRMAGWQAPDPWLDSLTGAPPGASYAGLVKVARHLFASSPSETTNRVKGVLRAFPTKPQLLGANKWSYELLGILTPPLFRFLVGDSRTEPWVPEGQAAGAPEIRSRVVIERCRFLEGSLCKGMCVALCKQPTEEFFNKELGIPMTMEPNFETGGCVLTWGRSPSAGGMLDAKTAKDLRCFSACTVRASPPSQASGATCPLLDMWLPERDYVSF